MELLIPFIIILVIMLPSIIVITHQQTVRMVETFGKFSSVRRAGLSFKLPWPIQTVSKEFSMRTLEIGEDVGVKSSDNAFVIVPIRVQFKVRDGSEDAAYYRLADPMGQIRSYVVNQIRATASGMTFNDLFGARDGFGDDVEEALAERMTEFGYEILNVLVDDPQPSEELRRAFDRVITAERLKDAAQNEGEAERIKAVATANAEGESLKIKARAYADFRNTIAEGNAEALKKFTAQTGLSETDALAFFTSINEMEALTSAAETGANVVFVAGSAKGGSEALLGAISARQS